MLANTLTLTVNAVATTLTRVREDGGGSVYQFRDSTQLIKAQIRQTVEKGTAKSPVDVIRSNLFIERTVFATPTVSQKYYSMSAVMRMGADSDPAYLTYLVPGFNTLLNAQAAAIVGGEV